MGRTVSLESLMTTEEVAQHFGVSPHAVVRMIRQERLRATKKGWVWLVHKRDLPATWPPPLAS